MAQSQSVQIDTLIEDVDAHSEIDEDDLEEFMREALDAVVNHLESNRTEAKRMSTDVDETVAEVLDPDNVRDVDIRARRLENPRVRVWLADCPMWANDAWGEIIYPKGMNAYNGKVQVTFDVRPF